MSPEVAGAIFFGAGLLAGLSQLLSPVLARRIGLIKTMVYSHLPGNAFLILAALMPSAPLAVACLLIRMAFSQMDVPARQSYIMVMVQPEERLAAASITSFPQNLASSSSPAIAGLLLNATSFGWPLIIGGLVKVVYDLLMLVAFQHRRPQEELVITRSRDFA
jgi:MFS family permease